MTKMQLTLKPCPAHVEAERCLAQMRAGQPAQTDRLEVLDLVLEALKDEVTSLQVVSGDKTFKGESATRLRFERGLDIRPAGETF